MDSIQLLSGIAKDLIQPFKKDLKHCFKFENTEWFWRSCERFQLLKYLRFAEESVLIETAQSLIYAFQYSGTMESLIQLSRGLFGKKSIVIIEDNDPATIRINIKNANTNFLYTLLHDFKHALIFKENEYLSIAFSDLSESISVNPHAFFQKFLTPGRVLKGVDVSAQ